ncbi:unnamed protein product [Thlaspi arvense]|uniref:Uncharacterized protein n=1 Tax=Thlaspi arvense TaxID=13288 RepID=A0AAU9RU37_THLAR|nr:unnamed protein product [Thlaspi arvense]
MLNSSSSVIADGSDVSPPQDLRKGKTFIVSYLVDSLGLTKKTRRIDLKRCGLLQEEVLSVLKRSRRCIGSSDQKIFDSVETFLGLGFTRDEFVMMVTRETRTER